MPASSGKYRETAASRSSFPSSTRVIAATLVTGLVIDAIQKIVSELLKLLYCDPESLLLQVRGFPFRAIATMAPGKAPASTQRLNQDAIRASRVVEKPRLSGSVAVIGPSPNATADRQGKIKIALAVSFIRASAIVIPA